MTINEYIKYLEIWVQQSFKYIEMYLNLIY